MLVALFAGSAAAADEAFSERQREAIGGIVREYLMKNPELLRDMMAALEEKEAAETARAQASALKAQADNLFRSPTDIVLGNPKGDVTIIEFFDYNCGYCKQALKDTGLK